MNAPSGLVNSTQQSSMAVRWITTVWLACVGVGDGVGEGAVDLAGRWPPWAAAAGVAGCGEATARTTRYAP